MYDSTGLKLSSKSEYDLEGAEENFNSTLQKADWE